MDKYLRSLICGIFLSILPQISSALPPGELSKINDPHALMIVDNGSYIHSNYILMFVTNHGNFGRDLARVIDSDYGTFYPYRSINDIINASPPKSPLYGAGLWIGGKVNGEIRIAASEYTSEYVPGPMVSGTFQTDRPEFHVYKLHSDSLIDNPNNDYLNWPVDQGAPVNSNDEPIILGDQLLWTIYNDADPSQRGDVDVGHTKPLGVEIHQQIWSTFQEGEDISIYNFEISVIQLGNTSLNVAAEVVDPLELTGHTYKVVTDSHPDFINVWHLINSTTGETLLENQTNFLGEFSPVIDGFHVKVEGLGASFTSFMVVANAAGPINPPEPAAAEWAGFPVPLDQDENPLQPSDNQQVGGGKWLFHIEDNGGSSGGGSRGSYEAFVERATYSGRTLGRIGVYDYEMRFTGNNSNPGVGGSYAFNLYDDNALWVPFELWRTGIGTFNDPDDDVRLIPLIIDYAGGPDISRGDEIYALESYGSDADGTCRGRCEHSVSDGDDDPFTDLVYWSEPIDLSFGEIGYQTFEAMLLDGGNSWDLIGENLLGRTVLVNWNGGVEPDFSQDVPEQGTIFRITTAKDNPPIDSFVFVAEPSVDEDAGYEASTIYIQYKIFNKGENTINDCYISLWVDPDLGGAWDDLVGCDTTSNIFFCYNAGEDDEFYGNTVPALGFKVLAGPLVPSPGNQAVFDGKFLTDFKNLGMSAFQKYIRGTDPFNFIETYRYMQGLNKMGEPYIYDGQPVKYMHSGDPVSGIGDLDSNEIDHRMMGTTGPITMLPGDSQYVLIKMAVGQGTDHLNSITVMKEILNSGLQLLLTGDVNGDAKLNVADAVFLINRVFRNGIAPSNLNNNDVNCDGKINIGDAVFLINHIFRNGPAPDCP
ncbi:MAG: dockerin type I domain-containing protein [candidate division Zixibacteria bacterium]